MWQEERAAWSKRSLANRDYVYVWAARVHFGVRLEDERLATLVLIDVRPDGAREMITLEDGYRESTEAWLSVLRELKARGMRAPKVAAGDGALGFWAALGEVFPETREQRCWVHTIANVLNKLPKGIQSKAKSMLHKAMNAPSRRACEKAIEALIETYGAKYPKVAKCLKEDSNKLMTHFDFPAEHWKHLRTMNPIESTFATVKHRTRVTKGAGSRAAGLAMAFKLLLTAARSLRRLDGHELLPQVRAGVRFQDGVRIEREDADGLGGRLKKTKRAQTQPLEDAA